MWAMLWGIYTSFVAYFVAMFVHPDGTLNDLHADSPWIALTLAIDLPRFLTYSCLVYYVSFRPRDSVLPYAVLQTLVSGTSALLTIFALLPVTVGTWVLYFPFTILCALLILSPWVVHTTFVLDSNYWRGLDRPSRLRGFGSVLIRLFKHSPAIPENYLDLEQRDDTDLFADLGSDSLVSKPLQKMLEAARKCLVDFAFVQIEDNLLGQGSFSKVFRGRYKGAPCAVKIFLRQPDIDARSIKLFARETQLARRLKHPNIVKFYGLCVRPPSVFLVFELCEQGDLFEVLAQRRAAHRVMASPKCTIRGWGLQRILQGCLETALPVAYLHKSSLNFVHRDIKSLNYLVTKGGTIKLSDFGTSRFAPLVVQSKMRYHSKTFSLNGDGGESLPSLPSAVTSSANRPIAFNLDGEEPEEDCLALAHNASSPCLGASISDASGEWEQQRNGNMTLGVGTTSWMAPEVAQMHAYGKPSDIFSLGVVMWEIITANEPYQDTGRSDLGSTLQDLRNNIRDVSLEALDEKDQQQSECWESLRVLVESALSVEPSGRPSADETVDRLKELQKRLQKTAVPAPPGRPLRAQSYPH